MSRKRDRQKNSPARGFLERGSQKYVETSMAPRQLELQVEPPSTKRGGKSATFDYSYGIDWLSVTFPIAKVPSVIESIRLKLFDNSEPEESHPWKGYQHALVFECGAKLSWHDVRSDAHLVMTGSACASAGLGLMVGFIRAIRDFSRVARIDLCYDVPREKALKPKTLMDMSEEGKLCSYRRFQWYEEHSGNGGIATTFKAGGRGKNGGGRHFRAYDKDIDGVGMHSHVRYEVEFSSGRADRVAGQISELPVDGLEGVSSYIRQTVLGAIDFREKGKSGHSSRCKRCDAWEKFVGLQPVNRVPPARRDRAFSRTDEWFCRQWGRYLYGLCRDSPEKYVAVLNEARSVGREKTERMNRRSDVAMQQLIDRAIAATA